MSEQTKQSAWYVGIMSSSQYDQELYEEFWHSSKASRTEDPYFVHELGQIAGWGSVIVGESIAYMNVDRSTLGFVAEVALAAGGVGLAIYNRIACNRALDADHQPGHDSCAGKGGHRRIHGNHAKCPVAVAVAQ